MLEENNKKIKVEIMETLQLTMEENIKSFINKINTKMKTFSENSKYIWQGPQMNSYKIYNQIKNLLVTTLWSCQKYTTKRLIQSLKSNASHNNSNQTQAQSVNRQTVFPGYKYPYHLSQMITQASQHSLYNMIEVPTTQQQTMQQINLSSWFLRSTDQMAPKI